MLVHSGLLEKHSDFCNFRRARAIPLHVVQQYSNRLARVLQNFLLSLLFVVTDEFQPFVLIDYISYEALIAFNESNGVSIFGETDYALVIRLREKTF